MLHVIGAVAAVAAVAACCGWFATVLFTAVRGSVSGPCFDFEDQVQFDVDAEDFAALIDADLLAVVEYGAVPCTEASCAVLTLA